MMPISSPMIPPVAVPSTGLVGDFVLDHDPSVLATDHDGGRAEVDLCLRIELLEVGERLVCLAVILEAHDEHIVGTIHYCSFRLGRSSCSENVAQ